MMTANNLTTLAGAQLFRHEDGHSSIHSEILIEAPADQVWRVLRDFDSMPEWSSGLQKITGDIRNGGQVQAFFLFQGKVTPSDHVLYYEEGIRFGWSEPLVGFGFPRANDHHMFTVEALSPSLTRFTQTDEFTSEQGVAASPMLGPAAFAMYPQFNADLRDRVLKLKKS
jgi:uncharacterized protein YndB with AHSA1/START domain